MWPNQGAANRRPAGQSGGSENLSAIVAADRAFPAAVAELGRWAACPTYAADVFLENKTSGRGCHHRSALVGSTVALATAGDWQSGLAVGRSPPVNKWRLAHHGCVDQCKPPPHVSARRPARVGRASCAPPPRSAAVAHLWRGDAWTRL